MRRPLFAVLSVLVAATLASGHSEAQGPRSAKTPAKAPTQKLESVMACMKYRQQRLVEDGGLRMELRNCCRGPVKCAISWDVRCAGGGEPEAKSADLEIPAGSTESALATEPAAETTGGGSPACAGTARPRRKLQARCPATASDGVCDG